MALLVLVGAAPANAQPKTDIVILSNGDRVTGEIKKLERGQLEFSTDDAGTLYLEWDKLLAVVTTREMEVMTEDGTRYLGHLPRAADRVVTVVEAGNVAVSLPILSVTVITPIGTSLWRRVDGSFDVGFSYTQSSGIAQLNVNSDTILRMPGFRARLVASLTAIDHADGTEDDRASVVASYRRDRWRRWFVAGAARFETNESLGLLLRSELGGWAGPRVINSNRAQLTVGAGLAVNDEQNVDAPATQNLELLLAFDWSYFTYDRPRTNLDLTLQYYPSLSKWGRQRVQLSAAAKREIFADFFLAANVYDSFDSQPADPQAQTNDAGVVMSIGWTY